MSPLKVHFVHVGNMNNKGTQALFKSDVYAIRDIVRNDVSVSVSTTDIEGVNRLDLSLNAVLPPVVDIPYEKADLMARRLGFSRKDLRYKISMLTMLFTTIVQIPLSVLSIGFAKIGLKALYRREVIEKVRDADLVISHSDESYKETASSLPLNLYWVITWWSMLVSRTWEVLVAKSFGKPVVMFPNSVGPFRTWVGRSLSGLSLRYCERLLIRDPISYDIVNGLGFGSQSVLTIDTALLFKSSTQARASSENLGRPWLGVAPGVYSNSLSAKEVQDYVLAHARALDAAVEKHGFFVFFLPHYISGFENDDLEICRMILGRMRNRERTKIVATNSVEQFKLLLDQMDMIVSSKMHPAVLGASGYVPIVCIAYDHKQTGFFKRLKMTDCTIDIRGISYKALASKIDLVWNRRKQIQSLLKSEIPKWQENVREAIEHAVKPLIGRR